MAKKIFILCGEGLQSYDQIIINQGLPDLPRETPVREVPSRKHTKASHGTDIRLSPSERIRADGPSVLYEWNHEFKIHQPGAVSQEGTPAPLHAREVRINGFHGRDSLQFKAAAFDQLSAALGKSGVDRLMQQFMRGAGQTGQKLAEQTCEQVPEWDHRVAHTPRPLQQSSEEIHEQVMAAFAAAERLSGR